MKTKEKARLSKFCFTILVAIVVLAATVGVLWRNADRNSAAANDVGTGTAQSPFLITNAADFNKLRNELAVNGTTARPRHFRIEPAGGAKFIDMASHSVPIPTLANHVVLDGGNSDGIVLRNLNASLFNNVSGPNTTIRNVTFWGNGNIANRFSGVMDNTHHVCSAYSTSHKCETMAVGQSSNLCTAANLGTVLNLATAVGGLVNFSTDATFRYCSNNASIVRSPGGTTNGGIVGLATGTLHIMHTRNTGNIRTMGAVEASGGLVGTISNEGDALIELSANIDLGFTTISSGASIAQNVGRVEGQRSGGLVGRKDGSGTLTIKESFNSGRVWNQGQNHATNHSSFPEAAGILAYAVGGSVVIEGCYNRGEVGNQISTTGNTAYAVPSGIFARNHEVVGTTPGSTPLANVTIRSCYSAAGGTANASATNGVRSAIFNHSFATVTASRNYARTNSFTNTNSAAAPTGTWTAPTATTPLPASAVTNLNPAATPALYQAAANNITAANNNGYPVIVGLTVNTFTFEANGGKINGTLDSTRLTGDVVAGDITSVTRVGFNFIGWSANINATTPDAGLAELTPNTFTTHVSVPRPNPAKPQSFYAVWQAKEYNLNFVRNSQLGDPTLEGQSYQVVDARIPDAVVTTVIIGQNINIRSYFPANPNVIFTGQWVIWDGTKFAQFNRGVAQYDPAAPRDAHLQLHINGESIITEEFIQTFLDGAGLDTIYLRAVYEVVAEDSEMHALRVDAGTTNSISAEHRDWGTLRIGTTAADTTPVQFPTVREFQISSTTPDASYYISAKANPHYRFVRFERGKLGDTILTPVAGNNDGNGNYSLAITIEESTVVHAIFERITYQVAVIARTNLTQSTPGVLVPQGAITDNELLETLIPNPNRASMPVQVNSGFSGVSLYSAPGQYKLVDTIEFESAICEHNLHPNACDICDDIKEPPPSNFAIWNHLTQSYDLRYTNNGEINLDTDSNFLDAYLNPNPALRETTPITIVAVYIQQIQVEVRMGLGDHTSPGLGVTQGERYGYINLYYKRGNFESSAMNLTNVDWAFDLGTSVEIDIFPRDNVRVTRILGGGFDRRGSDLDPAAGGLTLTINDLSATAEIVVFLEELYFTFDVNVTDTEGRYNFNDIAISTHVDFDRTYGVRIGPIVGGGDLPAWNQNAKDIKPEDMLRIKRSDLDPARNFNAEEWSFAGWYILVDGKAVAISVINGEDIPINGEFIETYLNPTASTHFEIQMRYSKIFRVHVELAEADTGDAEYVTVAEQKDANGTIIVEEVRSNILGSTIHTLGDVVRVWFYPRLHYKLSNVDGLNETETAGINHEEFYFDININEVRRILINFAPVQNKVATEDTLAKGSKLTLRTVNTDAASGVQTIGIGDTVILQFKPSAGYIRAGWTLNEIPVNSIRQTFEGSNARVSGNTLTFTVTWDMFNEWKSNDSIRLDSVVKTRINGFIVGGVIAVAIAIPILIIAIVFVMLANKKRREEYAVALQKMKVQNAKFGYANMISSLKEGN